MTNYQRYDRLKTDINKVKLIETELVDNQQLKLLPAEEVKSIIEKHGRINFIQWCYVRSIYTLPTIELVDWLKGQIKNPKKTLEICAGNNGLNKHLNIKSVDSRAQLKKPEFYKKRGQLPTQPQADIINLEAIEAIKMFKPNLVIAAWSIQKWDGINGFEDGVMEPYILPYSKYIHIGNHYTHAKKQLCKVKHETFKPDWLISRAIKPEEDCIYIWDKIK